MEQRAGKWIHYPVFLLLGIVTCLSAKSQDTATVIVRHIELSGNKKTHAYIILRELPFQEGDRIPAAAVPQYLEKAHDQLMNTFLFIDVAPGIKNWKDGGLDVVIALKERWYIFPIPYLKIIDRNFNQWWVEENHSLQRVDYGVHFSWYNITGRNDKIHLYAENGYNRLLNLGYESPYLDKKLRQFITVGSLYSNTKQVNFATDSNKQVFYPDTTHLTDNFIHRTVQGNIAYIYRIGVRQKHTIRFSYTDEYVSAIINQFTGEFGYSTYFKNGRTHIHYPELSYNYQYQNVDNIPYPLHGMAGSVLIDDKGLGSRDINYWNITVKAGYYRPLAPRTYLSLEGEMIATGPTHQPYSNAHLMGFGDMYLQGLEYYIVDGNFGALGKATVRREILDHNFPTIFKKSSAYNYLPIRMFLKAYANVGYVGLSGPQYGSFLNNRLLYSAGFGLDIVTFYDLQLKLEFSFNQLGKNGLFLHNYKGF
jgi:outer membrane protein assembly factor BamA